MQTCHLSAKFAVLDCSCNSGKSAIKIFFRWRGFTLLRKLSCHDFSSIAGNFSSVSCILQEVAQWRQFVLKRGVTATTSQTDFKEVLGTMTTVGCTLGLYKIHLWHRIIYLELS